MIDDLGLTILPYPEVSARDLVVASFEGEKPFKPSGEGHKDKLIWESVLAHIADEDSPHAFVTSNTSDFAQANTKGDFILHEELAEQLPDIVEILGFTKR